MVRGWIYRTMRGHRMTDG